MTPRSRTRARSNQRMYLVRRQPALAGALVDDPPAEVLGRDPCRAVYVRRFMCGRVWFGLCRRGSLCKLGVALYAASALS